MLNLNRTFQKNEFTNPESNDHIERFLLESSQVYICIYVYLYIIMYI
jgi:hypothetical protein